jgi:CubicO group peptidase (beta-lactamase class C family)
MNRRTIAGGLAGLLLPTLGARADIQPGAPEVQAGDAAAFEPVARGLRERWTDVQSAVVLLQGRAAFSFYRDDAPEALRNVQSVEKGALSALAGIALAQGHFRSLDQPVLEILPHLRGLNADARVNAITVRHVLSMTAGFEGPGPISGRNMPPAQAWARPLVAAPGERFDYDNALVTFTVALLEAATGMPLPDYARKNLVEPLAMAEPQFRPILHLRTIDMAKLGELFLRDGRWAGKQWMAADYVRTATTPQSAGGAPVGLPHGLMWWIPPAQPPGTVFLASGYAGQAIWVHRGLEVVLAATSTVSADSQQRGHSLALIRAVAVAAQARLPAR